MTNKKAETVKTCNGRKKKYFVSIDYTETTPIAYTELLNMATSPATPTDYADYLQYVFKKVKRIAATVGKSIEDFDFSIHEKGCVMPFGEGHGHPYCKNFFTEMELYLPI